MVSSMEIQRAEFKKVNLLSAKKQSDAKMIKPKSQLMGAVLEMAQSMADTKLINEKQLIDYKKMCLTTTPKGKHHARTRS